MEKQGLLQIETKLEYATTIAHKPHPEPTFELNEDQRAAVDQLDACLEKSEFSVQVLFGVTGSGKTEVYISAIRKAIAMGRQAIMLVPEIALTTQTVRRLQQRFSRVATIHSSMSASQRSRTWAAVASGEIPVVIGTRSAVFAPCPRLGLIIVDEEAEPSYKSQSAPRYHTRDAAVKRGQIEGIPVVLGSATPSLETWLNVQRRRHYRLLRLPRRVRGLAMPAMHLVDMNEEHRARPGVHMLSRAMERGLEETLSRGEQSVVLLNRRGYASYLHCAKCRQVLSCPHCSVRMVFHASTKQAHCHYCMRTLLVPQRCQNLGCDGTMVKFGLGTQRVEEEIGRRFPSSRVRRIDSDIMQTSADYADLLGAFERKEFDVLVGTQMVAKGLDFPFVSFVGVVSADTAMGLDDFRSEERKFQLVLQVAGRSGRAETGGSVVVQTFAADTAPIQHAVKGDFEGFARQELDRRKAMGLPPWTRMIRMILADGHVTKVRRAAEGLAERARELLAKQQIAVEIMEPKAASIARIRDLYRFDVLMIFQTADALMRAIAVMKDEGLLRPRVKSMAVDVDPVSLL
ncbi:MAG: primosomal protein N' [Planctomycetes bacterium]|nr:primosomal protein N' [Planctomycetota bacterium]